METKEMVQTGMEMVVCSHENDILYEFHESLMLGITPQLELSIASVLEMLSDTTVERSQLTTTTYNVSGTRIERGIRLDIERRD